jgi:ribosomal protein S6
MLNQTEDTEAWDSVKTFISGHDGTVVAEHSWGTRRLAYPIQKGQQKYLEGTYHLSRFETEVPFNQELENLLRLDERVLRSLIVSLSDAEALASLTDPNPGSADAPLGRRPSYQQRPNYNNRREDESSTATQSPSTTEGATVTANPVTAEPTAVPATETEAAAVPSTEAEPAAVPATEAEPAAVVETETEAAAVPSTEAEPAAVVETEAEAAAVPATETEAAAVPATEAEPAAVVETEDTEPTKESE